MRTSSTFGLGKWSRAHTALLFGGVAIERLYGIISKLLEVFQQESHDNALFVRSVHMSGQSSTTVHAMHRKLSRLNLVFCSKLDSQSSFHT
jgi:hypothetical protein